MSGETMTYDAYLEVQGDGACFAQLLDLPGCYGIGLSQDAALSAVAAAIPAYYQWLRRHDDYTPEVHGPFAVVPKEAQRVSVANGRRTRAFFAPAAEPVTNEDLDWALALLDWVYADFFELVSSLPPATLDGHAQGGASPVQHALHVAQEQLWLLSRIEPHPHVPQLAQLPGTPLDKLRQVWRASLHRLRNTSDDERARILEHDGERWSLRQVLHCSIVLVRMRTDALTRVLR